MCCLNLTLDNITLEQYFEFIKFLVRNRYLPPSRMGQDSPVGIVTHYRLDGAGIKSWWGARFSTPIQTGPGAHPASSLFPGLCPRG
jgi:hypothetical protein